jgi:hypothetical protein
VAEEDVGERVAVAADELVVDPDAPEVDVVVVSNRRCPG